MCFQLPPSLSLGPRGGGINVNKLQCCVNDPGEGGLPMKKGGDAHREISDEPLKGTNLGMA